MQCGPIRHQVNSKTQIMKSKVAHRVIVRKTSFTAPVLEGASKMSELYTALVTDESRNLQIFNDVSQALAVGRVPLLLTERTQHLDWFSKQFQNITEHLFVLRGGMKKRNLEATFQSLRDLPENTSRLILATGRYIGEGFDDPRLDTLFLALPISWQGTLQQYVGRIHRIHPNKENVIVYDYVDFCVPMLEKMYHKRLRKYRAMGYY